MNLFEKLVANKSFTMAQFLQILCQRLFSSRCIEFYHLCFHNLQQASFRLSLQTSRTRWIMSCHRFLTTDCRRLRWKFLLMHHGQRGRKHSSLQCLRKYRNFRSCQQGLATSGSDSLDGFTMLVVLVADRLTAPFLEYYSEGLDRLTTKIIITWFPCTGLISVS